MAYLLHGILKAHDSLTLPPLGLFNLIMQQRPLSLPLGRLLVSLQRTNTVQGLAQVLHVTRSAGEHVLACLCVYMYAYACMSACLSSREQRMRSHGQVRAAKHSTAKHSAAKDSSP